MNIPSRFGNIIKRAQGYDFLINDHRVDVNRKWTSQSFTNPTFDRSQNFIPAGNEHAVKFRENVIKICTVATPLVQAYSSLFGNN